MSSSTYILTFNDFFIRPGTSGPMMCHGINGLSLVLFWSPQCVWSNQAREIFRQMPYYLSGCHFAMANVYADMRIAQASIGTTSEIQSTPEIILYYNGAPMRRYIADQFSLEGIYNFTVETYNMIQNNTLMQSNPNGQQFQHHETKVKQVPAFLKGIGLPQDWDKHRTYLRMDTGQGNSR